MGTPQFAPLDPDTFLPDEEVLTGWDNHFDDRYAAVDATSKQFTEAVRDTVASNLTDTTTVEGAAVEQASQESVTSAITSGATLPTERDVLGAMDAHNDGRYAAAADFYSWSYANNSSGAGPGGVSIDATAAANIARNVTDKSSEGYVAIGRDALGQAQWGRSCIAIGPAALGWGNPGFGNVAIGTYALSNVTGTSYAATSMPGSRNVGIGPLAGHFIDSGYRNVYVGRDSGQTVTSGYRNTGVGYRAHAAGLAPIGLDGSIVNQYPVTGSDNSSFGDTSGALLTGSGNTTVGSYALAAGRSTNGNVVVGANAAQTLGTAISESSLALSSPAISGTYTQSDTTITVTATGHGAVAGNKVSVTFSSGDLSSVTTEAQWLTVASVPDANTFTVTSPASTTASGNCTVNTVETSTAATLGGLNVVIGYQALADAATSTGNNVIVGEQAARPATGGQNVVVGSRAGFNMTTGAQNTLVGYNAGRALTTGSGQTTQSNVTVVGYGAGVSGDNQVQLGNSATTTYVYGTVQNRSDARDKADVRDTELGLEFVNALRPVDYRWDMREDYIEYDDEGNVVAVHERDGSKKRERFHHGLIAQEVAEVLEAQGIEFGGLQDHTHNGGEDVLSIGYDELIGPLIRAVQQLSERVADLESSAARTATNTDTSGS